MMFEASDRTSLSGMDPSVHNLAFLSEEGREGHFMVKNAADYAALIGADAQNALVLPSLMDQDKVLTRHWQGFVDPAWWGVSSSKTASENSALLNECLATTALSRERSVRMRAGPFDISGNIVVPNCVSFEGQLGSGKGGRESVPGPTTLYCATEGIVLDLSDYSYTGGFDFRPASGYTPSMVKRVAGRGVKIGGSWYRGAFETCINVGDVNTNLQECEIIGGWISGCVNGVIIKQYRRADAYVNNKLYAAGVLAYDPAANVNYKCLVPHTSPSTGTFAANRSSFPTRWAEDWHAYGPADTNSGTLGPIDIHGASGVAIGLYNTAGWDIRNPKVQGGGSGSYGLFMEYQARGNKGMVYLENNGGTDLYCGTRCHTNEIDVCTLVPYPVTDVGAIARANNVIRVLDQTSGVFTWKKL